MTSNTTNAILAAAIGLKTLGDESEAQQQQSGSSEQQPEAMNNANAMNISMNPMLMNATNPGGMMPSLSAGPMAYTMGQDFGNTNMQSSNRMSQAQQQHQQQQASGPLAGYPNPNNVWSSMIQQQVSGGYGQNNGMSTMDMPNNNSSYPSNNSGMSTMDRFAFANQVAASAALHQQGFNSSAFNNPSFGMNGGMNNFPNMMSHMMNSASESSYMPLPSTATTTSGPTISNTKTFPETLFDIVSHEDHSHIVSWLPHGKGFVIHDKRRFASLILPRYFDGAKFTSFTRRLKRWSFRRISRGPELGAYYNDNFMRDQPELVQRMRYKTENKFDEVHKDEVDTKKRGESVDEGGGGGQETEKKTGANLEEEKSDKEDDSTPDLKKDAQDSKSPTFTSTKPGKNPDQSSDGPPNFATPIDNLAKPQLSKAQQELLLAQTMASSHQGLLPGASTSLGTLNSTSIGPSSMPSQSPFKNLMATATSNTAAQNVHAERMFQAERILQRSMNHSSSPGQGNGSTSSSSSSKTTALAKAKNYLPDHTTASAQQATIASLGDNGERPVLLNKKEEEEFAKFLLLKRSSDAATRVNGVGGTAA